MPIKTQKYKNLTWIDITEPDQEILEYLSKNFQFHSLDLKDLLGESQHPKIDIYKNYLFIIFHIPELDRAKNIIKVNELNVFLGKNFLITSQKKKIKKLKECYYRCAQNPKLKAEFFSQDSSFLLYKILESLFSTSYPIIDFISKNISEIEYNIFQEEKTKKAVKELAIIRRNVLNFRGIIGPQRLVIKTLVNLKKDFLSTESSIYFDDILDLLERIWVLLQTQSSTVQGLYETNESLISYKTNEVIKILTVISVCLLPLTLISGVYGMNIALPFQGNVAAVWSIYGVVLLIIVLVLIYFKKKDWL